MSLSEQPGLRSAECCANCARAIGFEWPDMGGYCSNGVPEDPSKWPDYVDREESMVENRLDLMEYVTRSTVCRAFKLGEPRDAV